MPYSRNSRPRRRHRGAAARRGWTILAIAVAVGVLLALGNLVGLLDSPPTVASRTHLALPDAIGISPALEPRRPTFGYSVIPGGVFEAHELTRAVHRDPVVAAHYRHVDPSTMRAETVTVDRLAYVSYRVDDRVYWTKRKLLIRSGETILTNGQIEIRSRCGNCISLAPMLPTSEDEPAESQFDALTDEPLLVAWGWGPSVPPLAVNVPAGEPDEIPIVGLLPLFPFGGAGAIFPGGPITTVPNDGPPGSPPQGGVPDSPPPGTSTPPGGVNPPFVGGTPAVGDSSPLEPFVLQALLSDEPAPPALPPTVPSEATPVPEPGTLLLVGSGIAGLLARRYRLKKASRLL